MEEKKMNLNQKLLALQKSVRSLTKDAKAYNYDYLSGNKLLDIVRPKMDELGLILKPEIMSISNQIIDYKKADRKGEYINATEILFILNMRFTWVDAESGEFSCEEWASAGMNGFDKGVGSALTYAERYYLMKFLHLSTDEDDVDLVASKRDPLLPENDVDYAKKQQEAELREKQEKRLEIIDKMELYAAKGILAKNGQTMRNFFIDNYHPTPIDLQNFDDKTAYYAENEKNIKKQ